VWQRGPGRGMCAEACFAEGTERWQRAQKTDGGTFLLSRTCPSPRRSERPKGFFTSRARVLRQGETPGRCAHTAAARPPDGEREDTRSGRMTIPCEHKRPPLLSPHLPCKQRRVVPKPSRHAPLPQRQLPATPFRLRSVPIPNRPQSQKDPLPSFPGLRGIPYPVTPTLRRLKAAGSAMIVEGALCHWSRWHRLSSRPTHRSQCPACIAVPSPFGVRIEFSAFDHGGKSHKGLLFSEESAMDTFCLCLSTARSHGSLDYRDGEGWFPRGDAAPHKTAG